MPSYTSAFADQLPKQGATHIELVKVPTTPFGDSMPIIRFEGWKVPGKEAGTMSQRLTTYQVGAQSLTSGISQFAPGAAVPMHTHNCEEQVTIVEGSGVATIDGVEQVLTAYDSTYVPAGVPHCFRNASDNPFVMLFVYPSAYVERHFTESGTMDWHGRPPAEAHGDD